MCLVGHPLDTIKVQVQTSSTPLSMGTAFRQITSNGGLLALYRGK